MSLYSLNKDMLIKIISDVNDVKNYPIREINKIRENCILELHNRNTILAKSTITKVSQKKKLVKGLENFHEILCDLKMHPQGLERLFINFTIYDIKKNKVETLVLSVINNGHNHFSRQHYGTYDAYLYLDFGQDKMCLTTSFDYHHPKCDLILLVTEIVIFYSNNQVYVEMEKH